jgi:chloramphenicol-sensitive protein RarD
VFCVILITVTRGWGRFVAIIRRPKSSLTLGLAGLLIVANWIIYVFATLSGHVVEAALGYFTNPIVTVLLGVLVLRERLRPMQWTAIGISALAVVVLAINYGQVPWIALGLAFSFGFYGLIKKGVSGRVDAVSGLAIETLWLSPVAIVMLLVVSSTAGLTLGTAGTVQTVAMLSAGVVTAVPLLMFASAASRLPLSTLGLTQYLAPLLQFLFGVIVLQEDMPPARWAGFALVWVALIVLTIDMLRAGRVARAAVLEPV